MEAQAHLTFSLRMDSRPATPLRPTIAKSVPSWTASASSKAKSSCFNTPNSKPRRRILRTQNKQSPFDGNGNSLNCTLQDFWELEQLSCFKAFPIQVAAQELWESCGRIQTKQYQEIAGLETSSEVKCNFMYLWIILKSCKWDTCLSCFNSTHTRPVTNHTTHVNHPALPWRSLCQAIRETLPHRRERIGFQGTVNSKEGTTSNKMSKDEFFFPQS